MLTKEQAIERLGQVGASDVPHLFNFDNKKPKDLWKEKTKQRELTFFENKYTIFGNITEYPCLKHFHILNKGDMSYGSRVEHKYIKNFVSSTDGLLNGVPVENKTIKEEKYKEGMMNKQYYIQLQSQIACTGVNKGYILYNLASEEDYEHPILYEPRQRVHIYDSDEKIIEEIESRVSYFLECMYKVEEPTEKGYKLYCEQM